MEPTNREFIVLYSQEEMRSKIEELKSQGYREEDFHVLVDDEAVLNAEDTSRIDVHETGTLGNTFKTMFTGKDAVREQLKKMELEERQVDRYAEDLENGAILLYMDKSLAKGDRNTMAFNEKENHGKDEIYTSEVSREEQYGVPGYQDEAKDSRVKGENIHPTTGSDTADESKPKEKLMEHEPGIASGEGSGLLDQKDGVNRREDEQSPGVDPNLGPAPFGRDSEEEHLLNDTPRRDDYEHEQNPRDGRKLHEDVEKKTGTPPTPRLF